MQFFHLTKFLKEAGVPEDNKISLAANCMRGAAEDWVSIKELHLKNYKDFSDAFQNRLWGQEK